MTTIALLLHERDDAFATTPYLLKPMLDIWAARGLRVETLRGPHARAPADLLIPHVDLTVTPPEYAAVYERYPRVLNRRVLDIAKSSFSANLVGPGADYDGPVIVKTDSNYGGQPERRLRTAGRRTLASRLARPLV